MHNERKKKMAELDRYLVLNENNEVVNVIMYDGEAEYNPGDGLSIEIHQRDSDGNYVPVDIGSVKNSDGTYTQPQTAFAPLS